MAVWLLTGATGFVGRHVLDALPGIDDRSGSSARISLLGRRRPERWPIDHFIAADLTDPDHLHEAIARAAPDFVIHTAGKRPRRRMPKSIAPISGERSTS
jgi:nucleoside-diphosphate-sugar epimerase